MAGVSDGAPAATRAFLCSCQRHQPYRLVMMKKTWRPAWPNSGVRASASNVAETKMRNSRRLPTMPMGHAQTLRRIPRIAEAKPKAFPKISIHGSG